MKVACLRYALRLSDRVHAPKLHQTPAANIECISLVCAFGKDHKWQSFLTLPILQVIDCVRQKIFEKQLKKDISSAQKQISMVEFL